MNYNKLSQEEKAVILGKATEKPYTGEYLNTSEKGIYVCRQCNAPLYKSEDKFDSHCGWPSFDDEIEGAVVHKPDADGRRTEIVCANCGGHLGHVFIGEGYTAKNTRHCVNSISMLFIPNNSTDSETVYFAGGCFWGTEYHFKRVEGVIETSVGFAGGTIKNPSYKEVCTGQTGYAEVVAVTYNPSKVDYEKLAKLFFEIHDFTQVNRQGPDIGEQYRTEIFYTTEEQKNVSLKLIDELKRMGYDVATQVTSAGTYYMAEEYHQDYYEHKGTEPYCHIYKKIF
ncbi:MAG: bifunctional methionine sulfoxide reductase B/A protein [Chlorobi bacterium]|nr:bifunctional methionine sulfoxide reductase B/A protein [Chlorobiota bacterium]